MNEAAKMDVMVQMHPKSYDSDRELKNFIFKGLKKKLPPQKWAEVQKDLIRLRRKK